MIAPKLVSLKKEGGDSQVRLLLMLGDERIGEARFRFWGKKSEVGILTNLTLSPEAVKDRSSHFDEWMIEQVKKEIVQRHCSRLIVYKGNPTAEERKLYERLGFQKSIFGFCQSFSHLY